MATIGFIGLGNMGRPMAANLVRAGHAVQGYYLFETARNASATDGVKIASSAGEAAAGAEIVISMLPSGKHDIVRLRQELLRREQTEAESVT